MGRNTDSELPPDEAMDDEVVETAPELDITLEEGEAEPAQVLRGVEVIRAAWKTLPNDAGVYRMFGNGGEVLYVGKAKNLKKRVASYTRNTGHSNRIARMISETQAMEFVTTGTETQALLLETNYIKQLRPRYNVLMRDDKSFPYILVTGALLGQMKLTKPLAEKAVRLFGLSETEARMLNEVPMRGTPMPPTDPFLYRFYERVMVNGPAWKALIEEEFGDGIMSAIDFDFKMERVANPKGDRVQLTMSGKFLPYKYYDNEQGIPDYGFKES